MLSPDAGPRVPTSPGRRRRPLWLGTSWKMTKTLAEAQACVEELVQGPVPAGVEVFVLPPLTALHAVRAALPDGSPVRVGAQNAHWAPDGPVTGEVSMRLVRDAGAEIVEIGHSDRRSELGETDQVVAAKVRAALDQHLLPSCASASRWSARAPGRAAGHVADQVRAALAGVGPTDLPRLLIAYEPVWAIGDSGIAAAPSHIAAVLGRVRTALSGLAPGAEPLGILYGGSVSDRQRRRPPPARGGGRPVRGPGRLDARRLRGHPCRVRPGARRARGGTDRERARRGPRPALVITRAHLVRP